MAALVPTENDRLAPLEHPGGSPVMHQRWAGLLFLHWPISPAMIQERLPEGLFVDTFEGMAWVGVVPFFMEKVRIHGNITAPLVLNLLILLICMLIQHIIL